MKYKIHTTPIYDAFKAKCDCPLCLIESNISEKLVSQYINEAVMEPIYRVEVNKFGFCEKHATSMCGGDNKLGVALQLATRTDYLKSNLGKPDKKKCKADGERIFQSSITCVICKNTADTMSQYQQTIAMMWNREKDFRSLLSASQGFCLRHFGKLVSNAASAGSETESFLNEIYRIENEMFSKLKYNLDGFAEMFDYRQRSESTPEMKSSVTTAIKMLTK